MHASSVTNVIHASPRSNPVLQVHTLRVRQVSVVVPVQHDGLSFYSQDRQNAPPRSLSWASVSYFYIRIPRRKARAKCPHRAVAWAARLGHGSMAARSAAFGLIASALRPQGLPCQLAAAAHQRSFSPRCIWHIYHLDTSFCWWIRQPLASADGLAPKIHH